MIVTNTSLADCLIIQPKVHADTRGEFAELWNLSNSGPWDQGGGSFVQANQSVSNANVLRGLHYQLKRPQGKLVQVMSGSVIDVVVDLRKGSSTFLKTQKFYLEGGRVKQLWVPPGFAHGFYVTSERVLLQYWVTDFYDPEDEYTILWSDPDLNIDWELRVDQPIVSEKDKAGVLLSEAKYFD